MGNKYPINFMSDEEDEYYTIKLKNNGLKTTNIQKRDNKSSKLGQSGQSGQSGQPQNPIYSEKLEDTITHEANISDTAGKKDIHKHKISKVTLIGKEQEFHENNEIPEIGEIQETHEIRDTHDIRETENILDAEEENYHDSEDDIDYNLLDDNTKKFIIKCVYHMLYDKPIPYMMKSRKKQNKMEGIIMTNLNTICENFLKK